MAVPFYKNSSETVVKHSLNNMSEAKNILRKGLMKKGLSEYNFVENVKNGTYHFDFFCHKLNLGIQLDGYSYCFDEIYNSDQIKTFNIAYKGIKVVKITDYQVIIDMDEVLRYLKIEISNKSFTQLIA